ncbi:MAG TPA: DUF494 family protein [Candidatus Hydrogenedens sp.]|nr:DUF494 family protein [Candidatus Hydrogenedens sp.]HOK09745.1 DUF494 family protein [Candidatus Hydrogenedens sp.]HOL19556.1 DUF494 family protein [Candidatus Hydrogenedens sp.]HPP58209.1 DUF494 family protein [Candidatus Hydrogenedens sp.]
MNSEVKKIEDKIKSFLQENRTGNITKTTLRRKLSRQGFKSSDIEDALNRVWKKQEVSKRSLRSKFPKLSHTSFYIPEQDRLKLSDEAYTALQRLHYFQMITPIDRILLLEWLEQSRGKVNLEVLINVIQIALGPRYTYEEMKMIIGVALGDETVFV